MIARSIVALLDSPAGLTAILYIFLFARKLMEQRQPRLGDILDDYCPQEKRITNHAVVAMLGDEIQQTRCVTCEDEHPYKSAKVPATRRRRKPQLKSLSSSALSGNGESSGVKVVRVKDDGGETCSTSHASESPESLPEVGVSGSELTLDPEESVHRPLIRATLPRPERTPQSRQLPEFTVRQKNSWDDEELSGKSQRSHSQNQGRGSGKRPPHRDRSMNSRNNGKERSGMFGNQSSVSTPNRTQRTAQGRRKKAVSQRKKRSE